MPGSIQIDWSLVLAAALGAAIGILGQWLGSLGSRRHTRETYQRALEQSRQEHERSVSTQREASLRDRERFAIEAIVTAFQEGHVGPLMPDTELDSRGRANRIVNVIAFERIFVREPRLRYRLGEASIIIEGLEYFSDRLTTTRASVHWIVRTSVLRSLSAYVRAESVPDDTPDWSVLASQLDDYRAHLESKHREHGVNLQGWQFPYEMY